MNQYEKRIRELEHVINCRILDNSTRKIIGKRLTKARLCCENIQNEDISTVLLHIIDAQAITAGLTWQTFEKYYFLSEDL